MQKDKGRKRIRGRSARKTGQNAPPWDVTVETLSDLLVFVRYVRDTKDRANQPYSDWGDELALSNLEALFKQRFGYSPNDHLMQELALLCKYSDALKADRLFQRQRDEIVRRAHHPGNLPMRRIKVCDKGRKRQLTEDDLHRIGRFVFRCLFCPKQFTSRDTGFRHVRGAHRAELAQFRRGKLPIEKPERFPRMVHGVQGQPNKDVALDIVDMRPEFAELFDDRGSGWLTPDWWELAARLGCDEREFDNYEVEAPWTWVWLRTDDALPPEVLLAWVGLQRLMEGRARSKLCPHCDVIITKRAHRCSRCKERLKKQRQRGRAALRDQ